MKLGRLSWRKQPSETGLARVCQAPRGAILRWAPPGAEGKDIGRVYPRAVDFHKYDGWYWYAKSADGRIRRCNTANNPVETLEEAKAACLAYVRAELSRGAK